MELLTKSSSRKGLVSRERQKFLPVAAMHPHLSPADRDVGSSPAGEGY